MTEQQERDQEHDDDECPICGGEGVIFDCFDHCCADAEFGCDDCTRPCQCQRSFKGIHA